MRALVLVDLQNDFLPGGALAVPAGDAVVSVANRLLPRFDIAVATQDWHPPGHASFASSHPGLVGLAGQSGHAVGDVIDLDGLPQVLWPDHCVQHTAGASFASGLDVAGLTHVVRKGMSPRIDSYSGFFDNGHRRNTGLHAWLEARGVTELWVMGLATDYCVRWTALDAVGLGYRVVLVPEGCQGVELAAGDSARAIAEMVQAGVRLATASDA